MRVEQGLLYTKDHEWIKVEGNVGYVGVTDFAQSHLGDIVYVELPEVGDEIGKEDAFASVESVKTAADVNMPASGKVEEVNEALNDDPALINADCYANWMVKIAISDPGELDSLMSPEAYEEFASKEE
ncbi:MAG: glycine cleavage system protein GcvH [Peptostreptococcaceae bacterium]|nr:glycine cleavage system protein GcvH [Peptostreptococcaceae bacterium]